MGTNLFQSFGTFNLGTGDTASFLANTNTLNIIARVTGGSASSIDGTLQSPVNLFLLNPAGVMFGANAQLSVTGAFAVSTANDIKFNDNTVFYGDVNHAINDAGLSAAPVSAFGFLSSTPKPISFAGTQLSNPGGIHVICGDITLDQGTSTNDTQQGTSLLASGGNLTLFSAASAGEVPFSLTSPGSGYATAPFDAFGNITVQNKSTVAIDGAGGGNLIIRGGQIVVDNSTISSANSGSTTGGTISVQADQLSLSNGGNIVSATSGSGDGGAINIQGGSATIDGVQVTSSTQDEFGNTVSTFTPSAISSHSSGSGHGGAVSALFNYSLSLTNGGQISSTTSGSGTGGSLNVQAPSLSIDGVARDPDGNLLVLAYSYDYYGDILSAQASATGISSETSGPGNGGVINVVANLTLNLTNGAEIAAGTSANGNGGAITVEAGSASFDGAALLSQAISFTSYLSNSTISPSGIVSQSTGTGSAGAINVTVNGNTSLTNGAEISADSTGGGPGSEVSVTSGTLTLSGVAVDAYGEVLSSNSAFSQIGYPTEVIFPSEISSQTTNSSNPGAVGVLVTGTLTLSNGAEINTNTYGPDNAGNVTVTANTASLEGGALDEISGVFTPTEISATTYASGNAGTVTITATGSLDVTNGAQIGANSGQTGITGAAYGNDSPASGNPGTVSVTAGSLDIEGSSTYSTYFGGLSPSEISAAAYSYATSNNGGIVTVNVGTGLTMTNGAEINASAYGNGSGGNVTVTADSLSILGAPGDTSGTLCPSEISALSGGSGVAGTVNVTVTGLLSISDGGEISANGFGAGNSGTVTVMAGAATIDGAAQDTSYGDTSIFFYPSDVAATSYSTGNAGTVSLTVTGALSVTNGGEVNADSADYGYGVYATGNAGSVTISAGTMNVAGIAVDSTEYISFPSDISATAFSFGNAGEVNINTTGALTLSGGAEIIASNTFTAGSGGSTGTAGTITITAGTLSLTGALTDPFGTFDPTLISSNTYSSGNAGVVTVTVNGSLAIAGGAQISANTNGPGNGGQVDVTAGSVSLDGVYAIIGYSSPSEISSNASDTGNAGTVDVTVNEALTLTNGAEINTGTVAGGNGGNATLQASSVSIDGALVDLGGTLYPSEITSSTSGAGNAGNVSLNLTTGTGSLSLTNGGIISSATSAMGTAGDIAVQANTISLNNDTSISSQSKGGGSGGSVAISAGDVTLADNSTLDASSTVSDAGTVQMTASNLSLNGNSSITTSAPQGNGGNIQLRIGGMVYLLNGAITASALGTGGNIMIDPQFVILDDSLVSAFGGISNGNIIINTAYFLPNESPVQASGALTINAPDLDLSGSLIPLSAMLENNDKRLRENCARSIKHEFSSFIVVGRGGTEAAPEELQPDFGMDSIPPASKVGPELSP